MEILFNCLDGATRLVFVVGDPVAQALSPHGVTEALQRRGMNMLVAPAHVSSGHLEGFFDYALCIKNVQGILVTVPHKAAAARLCNRLSERARLVGAVNMIRRETGGWYGDMIDGIAYVAAMNAGGLAPKGKRVLLVGAGGVGAAIAHELVLAGVTELAVHDAEAGRMEALLARLQSRSSCKVRPGSSDPMGFDIVINATPLGVDPIDPMPFDVERVQDGTALGDVVQSEDSPLVRHAKSRGLPVLTGVAFFHVLREQIADFISADALPTGVSTDAQ